MLKSSKHEFMSNSIYEMLKEMNIEYKEELSHSQQKAFDLLKNGNNLLIISPAGTGKSYLIKYFENYIKHNTHKTIAITSTTGISAYNLDGMTIHSFMGIGTGDLNIDQLIKRVYTNKQSKQRIENIDILVIDEISMLSAEIFEKINLICQKIRKNKLFFGGIQIIFTGDFNQLLCVFNTNEDIYKNIDERYIFESLIFNNEFNKKNNNIIQLTENFRQKNDKTYMELLLRIRNGTYTENDINILNKRRTIPENNNLTHIVTTNKQAQIINQQNLEKISSKIHIFEAEYTRSNIDKYTEDILFKELKFQFNKKGIEILNLKIGSRVMLLKNIDITNGLVNGALGNIKDINNKDILVEFDNNISIIISQETWTLELNDCSVSVKQIPLMLAYACTVHKIQGLTLDNGILDISNAFCDHLVYVALSRIKSLDGLYLKSFNPNKIKINAKTQKYLDNIHGLVS